MHNNIVDFKKIFSKMPDDFRNFRKLLIQHFPLYGIFVDGFHVNVGKLLMVWMPLVWMPLPHVQQIGFSCSF